MTGVKPSLAAGGGYAKKSSGVILACLRMFGGVPSAMERLWRGSSVVRPVKGLRQSSWLPRPCRSRTKPKRARRDVTSR